MIVALLLVDGLVGSRLNPSELHLFVFLRQIAWNQCARVVFFFFGPVQPPYSAGTCTIERNTGAIAATGTTRHTATTGCFYLCPAISQAL